jgi:vacuolar-type H+-ATPase subunit H
MIEGIINEIRQKEQESNRKIMNARLKADSLVKTAEKKKKLLIKKCENEEKKIKEKLLKQALNDAKKEIEKIRVNEKRKLITEIKKAEKNEKKATQFVKNFLCG